MTYTGNDLGLFSDEPTDYYGPYGGGRAERRQQQNRRRRRRRRGRVLGPVIALIVVAGIVGGLVVFGGRVVDRFTTVADYAGQGTGEAVIQVEGGDSAGAIAATLTEAGVVKSEKAFVNAANADTRSTSIQPGYYKLRKEMSGSAALALLLDPASRLTKRVNVPEGSTAAQIAALVGKNTTIKAADMLAAFKNVSQLGLPDYARTARSVEGFLFPASYEVDPGTTAVSLAQQMVATYAGQMQQTGITTNAKNVGRTPYQILIVASMIERETKVAADGPKIARVIYNRLARNFYLGVDASILYGLGRTSGGLTAADLAKDTPYNNRIHTGLPPTPISNPSLGSVQAALNPTPGPWLYYVLKDKQGNHLFTADRDEFNTAKANCQRAGLC